MNSVSKTLLILILTVSFLLMVLSSRNDSLTFDENAHIAAGYSYLTRKDAHLNPEHPPLIKDIATFPLLFLNLNFDTNTAAWRKEVNGQWNVGQHFLYESGNNPDTILHFSRFPMMLLAILGGILLFLWSRSLYGNKIALLAAFFYAFSPTIIAHARYVTTDIGALIGFLAGIATFLRFLQKPTKSRLAIAGVVFGIAQLIKFSLFLLVPLYIILGLVWLSVQEEHYARGKPRGERMRLFGKNTGALFTKIGTIFIIGLAIIWTFYAYHTWNYPQERQLSDAAVILRTFRVRELVNLDLWLTGHSVTRPTGQYLLGLMMTTQRAAGGNSAYFLGKVSSAGWKSYFPIAYILKETIGMHLLALLALWLAMSRIMRAREKSAEALRGWIGDNFALFASLLFVLFYWTLSVLNPLNIGVRHLLPTFPFMYLLVSRELVIWLSGAAPLKDASSFGEFLRLAYHKIITPIPKILLIAIMLFWIFGSVIYAFPFYLSYYNELVGTKNGYLYITDSNYDWGQDLKRLRDILETRFPNEPVYLSYFGGGAPPQPNYLLGGRYIEWWSSKGPPPSGVLFAISANILQGSISPHTSELTIKEEDTFPWLRGLEPFGRAGTTIFLYRMP